MGDNDSSSDESEVFPLATELSTNRTDLDKSRRKDTVPPRKTHSHVQYASDNPDVYIPKLLFSDDVKRKTKRIDNRRYACLYCPGDRLMTNIASHLRTKHKDEESVQDILKTDPKKNDAADIKKQKQKKVANKLALLRNHGNFNHNAIVLEKREGEFLVARRQPGDFVVGNYSACPHCLEFINIESTARKHRKTCPGLTDLGYTPTPSELLTRSDIMEGKVHEHASDLLKREVLCRMRRDNVAAVAKRDKMIVTLGNSLARRLVGNPLKRPNYTSSHMRSSAELLICLRQLSDDASAEMDMFLSPKYFDLVADAAVKISVPDIDDDEDLQHPSTSVKIKYDIIRMANHKLAYALKEGCLRRKTEADEFLRLLGIDWTDKVDRLARNVLNERRFNKEVLLPAPEDVTKLAADLRKSLNEANYDLHTYANFREIAELTESRLIMYNKRRCGELEAMTRKAYINRKKKLDEVERGVRGVLSELELKLAESQDLIEIRGKVGHKVPVLVPNDTKLALHFLSDKDVRRQCGIRKKNMYMFANDKTAVFRAYDSLKKMALRSGLKYPERITSTNLRKYMATLCQVFNLKDNELEYVCRHMGHTSKVHKQYYRAMSHSIEKIDVAKLLLAQEYGVTDKLRGKSLSDIEFSGNWIYLSFG